LKLLIAVDKSRFSYLKPFANELSKLGIDCLIVDDLAIYDNSIFDKKYLRWLKTPNKFKQIIVDFKPDLVFTERTSHFGLLVLKAKIPLCIFLRGDPWAESELAKKTIHTSKINRLELWIKERIAQKCFRDSTLILPICKYLENITRQHYPEKNIATFYQGIDLLEWYQTDQMDIKHPCVGLLQGAWIWGKTKEMLTLTKVMEAMPHVTFYWAGDGPYREKIFTSLSRHKNFKWLGPLSYPDKVREYLSSIDIYALVSGMDMAPHTILEASAMRKPIIATNVGGIPELVNSNTVDLIKVGDYQEWINKITLLLRDTKKQKQMGDVAYGFVKDEFCWEGIAKRFVKIIDSFGIRSNR